MKTIKDQLWKSVGNDHLFKTTKHSEAIVEDIAIKFHVWIKRKIDIGEILDKTYQQLFEQFKQENKL